MKKHIFLLFLAVVLMAGVGAYSLLQPVAQTAAFTKTYLGSPLPVTPTAMFQSASPTSPIRKVSALPATCTVTGSASSTPPVVYQGKVYHCTSTNTWTAVSAGSSSITINGLTNTNFTLAVGTSGTDFAVANSGSTVTFNLPDASATARGLVTTGAQTIAGVKTFSSAPVSQSGLALHPSGAAVFGITTSGSNMSINGIGGASVFIQDNGGNNFMTFNATSLSAGAPIAPKSYTFAGLPGSPVNSWLVFCSDCTKATPCASGGSGALAKRINGAWDCN